MTAAHHTEDGFRNIYIEDPEKNFFSFLAMRWFGEDSWPDHSEYADSIPFQQLDLQQVLRPAEQPQISWLGHSTFLIQYQGINILTDPIFSDYASPTSLIGPKRYVPHTVDYKLLPEIDYVIISHNHYDHLDLSTLEQLLQQDDKPQYFVPLGIGDWLLKNDLPEEKFTQMDWWQEWQNGAIKVSAMPSQHWSGRGLWDRRKTLWASWYVQIDSFQFWFAGDTGFSEDLFKTIGSSVAEIDLALIPVGAYAPRDFMKAYHVNPHEAVKIHQLIGAAKSIGMHWGTFPLSAEKPTEPPRLLKKAVLQAHLQEEAFQVMTLGQTLQIRSY